MAIAESGRDGEIRYLGELDYMPDVVVKLVRKLANRYETLHICYEAVRPDTGCIGRLWRLGTTAWWWRLR